MKVDPQVFRGIVFVDVDDLPSSQQILLKNSPDYPERIKILIGNKTRGNCIQYKDYEQWFHSIYIRSVAPTESLTRHSLDDMPIKLAFD